MANKFFHSISASEKRFTMNEVVRRIKSFVEDDDEKEYQIYIGSDSHCLKSVTIFVTAIVIHRVGKGAIYFYCKWHTQGRKAFVDRIYEEAYSSIEIADSLITCSKEQHVNHPCCEKENIVVHVDAGTRGKTQILLQALVGLVRGSGFNCGYKPNAFSATYVADRHTKS